MEEMQIIINIKVKETDQVKSHDQLLNDMPGDMKMPEKPRIVHEIHVCNHQFSGPSIRELARLVASELVRSAAH